MYSKFVKPFFPTFGNDAKLRLSHPTLDGHYYLDEMSAIFFLKTSLS